MDTGVNVLWTGGSDSTYRVIDLLLNTPADIYPFYVKYPRRSADIEIDRIKRISDHLTSAIPNASSRLKELEVTPYKNIPANQEIEACYWKLRQVRYIGRQYAWLARFVEYRDLLDVELSAVKNGGHAYIYLHDKVVPCFHHNLPSYRLAVTEQCESRIFGRFLFPLLYTTKDEMRTNMQQWGFSYISDMTWFCHKPIMDRFTCGTCRPCTYVMDEGLKGQMHWIGKVRFYTIEGTKRNLPKWLKDTTKLYLNRR